MNVEIGLVFGKSLVVKISFVRKDVFAELVRLLELVYL